MEHYTWVQAKFKKASVWYYLCSTINWGTLKWYDSGLALDLVFNITTAESQNKVACQAITARVKGTLIDAK